MSQGDTTRSSVTASALSRTAPAVVFCLLKDGATWPDWSMFDSFELERPGTPDRYGVGAIRVFATRVSRAREEVVDLEADRSLTYRLLSGLPLRNYQATVTLTPVDRGTSILWSASFGPQPFGTTILWRLFMRHVLGRTVRDLAVGAEKVAGISHPAPTS